MDILSSFVVIAFAALIHASFQLSVSVLSLMSGHAIGAKRSHAALMRLISSFITGAGVMTLLLTATSALLLQSFFGITPPPIVWAAACGLLFGLGLAVWVFYYRRGAGTMLWIPRGMARFLSERSKKTRLSPEAFGLGLTSVLAELLFLVAPILVAALVLVGLPSAWQLAGIALYAGLSSVTLLIVGGLVGGGHRLSSIQRWRETNKNFLQFSAACGLIILGVYLYVNQIVATAALTGGN